MNIEEFKTQVTNIVNELLPSHFSFKTGVILHHDIDVISMEGEIIFDYGNCRHNHIINVGWAVDDGIGLEIGEYSEIYALDKANVMEQLYYSLALIGLDDEYQI